MEQGSTTNSELTFVSSNATASAGTYAVNITQAATAAAASGSGFSGTYSDAGASDYITVTDSVSGAVAQVQLTDGMTTQQIIDALNTQFNQAVQQKRLAANTLYSDDPPTTAITSGTTFSSVYAADATPASVSAGDTISYSGARPDGTLFAGTYEITDPGADTIGDFVNHLQQAIGNDVTVSISSGRIQVEDVTAGTSDTSLSLVYNGDGALDFGAMELAATGRFAMSLTASLDGNQVVLEHGAYGSANGFTIDYTGDDTAQLGLTAQAYAGTDVAGTIGSYSATGSGRQLIGVEGTEVEGLHLSYDGSSTGDVGYVTVTVGAGALIERQLDLLLQSSTGLLATKNQDMDEHIARLEDRLAVIEERLARRRQLLIQKFTAMEMLLGQFQTQSAALGSQINSLYANTGSYGT
jgi:flagellar hook-associated protein 2